MVVEITAVEYRHPQPNEDLKGSARWIWLDHQDFYGIFWDSESAAVAGIEELLRQPESDLGNCLLAVRGETLLGAMCFFPLNELPRRSLVSLRYLLANARNPGEACSRGRQFAGQVPRLDGTGLYLARIAVAENAQGMGVGRGFMRILEEQGRTGRHGRLCLHVRRDNARARRFYEKRGFVECADRGLGYLGMEKWLDKSSPPAG